MLFLPVPFNPAHQNQQLQNEMRRGKRGYVICLIIKVFTTYIYVFLWQLGAKKVGGLGAQKVTKIDFEKLEKNAEEADKVQHRISVSSAHSDEKSNDESRWFRLNVSIFIIVFYN